MKILSSFTLVFRLILILGVTTFQSTAGIRSYKYQYELDIDQFSGICPSENLLAPLQKCMAPFLRKMIDHATQSKIEYYGYIQKKIATAVPKGIFCCAVNELNDCFVKEIRSSCGPYVEKKAESIVSMIINSDTYVARQLGNQTSSCDAWYYESGSPVCWERKSQLKIGIFLSIILFISCCSCCCKICSLCC